MPAWRSWNHSWYCLHVISTSFFLVQTLCVGVFQFPCLKVTYQLMVCVGWYTILNWWNFQIFKELSLIPPDKTVIYQDSWWIRLPWHLVIYSFFKKYIPQCHIHGCKKFQNHFPFLISNFKFITPRLIFIFIEVHCYNSNFPFPELEEWYLIYLAIT